MKVNKLLTRENNIVLNFSKIRDNQEYKCLLENFDNKKIKFRKLKFVLYTMSVILVTSISTIVINNLIKYNKEPDILDTGKPDNKENHQAGSVYPGKESNIVKNGILDKLICFGPEVYLHLYQEETILNSNMISENDKVVLREYLLDQQNKKKGHINYFVIYFGIKDNKDIVLIVDVSPVNNSAKSFYFESNLSYSFESIIKDLEQIINTTITDDFLQAAKYENGKQVAGIILDFNQDENGVNTPYYKVIINDQVYVLNK